MALSCPEYAKAGTIPQETIVLEAGPLEFNPSMMEQLRKLGLVVEMNKGSLELRSSFIVARAGEPLSPEQAKLLAHMQRPLINFSIQVESFWSGGNLEEF